MSRGATCWFNGELKSVEDCKISLFTHALHYGCGVFEGIRAYKQKGGGGAIFRLREHMVRFHESFKCFGYDIPYSVDELCNAAISVAKENGFEECYIRPIAYLGDGPLGLSAGEKPPIEVAILSWEWGKYLGDDILTKGIRLMTSSFIRPHVNSLMTKAKITGQYVTGVMAKREAISHGFDEALLLDPQGYIAEGTGENIFMIKNGVIKTTPLTSVLNGITRQTIMLHLQKQGHEIVEGRFSRDEVWCADEVFLTGTAAEVTPVCSIDNRKIGDGVPGPVATKTAQDYDNIVRGDVPAYGQGWLTQI